MLWRAPSATIASRRFPLSDFLFKGAKPKTLCLLLVLVFLPLLVERRASRGHGRFLRLGARDALGQLIRGWNRHLGLPGPPSQRCEILIARPVGGGDSPPESNPLELAPDLTQTLMQCAAHSRRASH